MWYCAEVRSHPVIIIRILIVLSLIGKGMNSIFNDNEDKHKKYEDAYLDTGELIIKYGYPVEKHVVQTEDGYLLTMFRIPSSKPMTNRSVLVQHGLLCSSTDFIILGPQKSIGYLLADAGYDVWLGNTRGNPYSRAHVYLDPNEKKFWQFSWHEIGVYDLPAMIDYILKMTLTEKLFYIGHSQGDTSFYVMASELPQYNDKIRLMINLSPVAFMSNVESPLLRLIAPITSRFKDILTLLGGFEFNIQSELHTNVVMEACNDEAITQLVCINLMFIFAGFDYDQVNTTTLPIILNHFPASASTMQSLHYLQLIESGKFRQYDYGVGNLLRYKQFAPPEYILNRVTAPIVLMYGVNDWLSSIVDVQNLEGILSNVVYKYEVPDPSWNHLDFIYAKDIKILLNDKIIELLSQY